MRLGRDKINHLSKLIITELAGDDRVEFFDEENKIRLEQANDATYIIHGIKLRNKGAFTIHKLTITAPGQQSQEYTLLPIGSEIKPSGSKDTSGNLMDFYNGLGDGERGIAFTFNDIESFKKNPNIK